MQAAIRVLYIEDSPDDAALIERLLKRSELDVAITIIETAHEMEKALSESDWDIILADYKLHNFTGLQAHEILKRTGKDIPFILVSATIGEELAVAAMKAGIQDYVMKDKLSRLAPAIVREINDADVRRKHRESERMLRENEKRLNLISDAAHDLITVVNRRWVIEYTNQFAANHFGVSPADLVGKNLSEIFPPEIAQRQTTNLRKILDTAQPLYIEASTVFPDKTLWLGTWLVPIRNEASGIPDSVLVVSRDITNRMQTEEALRESERRYREVVETATEVIFTTDEKGYFRYCNPAGLKLSGYSLEELRSLRFSDIIVESHRKRASIILYRQVVSRREIGYLEFPFLTKSGKLVWVGQNTQLIIEDDRIKGFRVIARDITKRKIAEDQLKQAEENFRGIVENATLGIFQTTPDGKFIMVNQVMAKMLGYDSPRHLIEERTDIQSEGYVDPRKRVEFQRLMEEDGGVKGFEYEVYRKDKSIISVRESARPVRDTQGHILYYEGFFEDITEKKHADENLRLLSSAFNAAANAILITDREGEIQSINPAFTRLTGYTFAQIRNKNPRILKSNHQNAEFYEDLWQTITHGKVWKGTQINKRKDGTLYHEEQTITPIKNEHGEITHFISIKEDISERKRAEQELLSAKEQAEQADKLKDAFIANISHEIRTPLNVMFGFLELLRQGEAFFPPNEIEEFHDSIRRSGHRLMRTVDEILSISLLTTGAYKSHYETIDVAGQLEALVVDLQPLAHGKNLYLELAAESHPRIDGDLYSFIQTVSNLLDNAIKFTKTGGVFVHVFEEQDAVKVSIRDTGIGIAEEYLPSLYQAFSQEIGGYTRPYEGVGLGMALVTRYMDVNKGHIEVHSEKNKGTEFVLTFPRISPGENTKNTEST